MEDLTNGVKKWLNDEQNYLAYLVNPDSNREYIIMNLISCNLQLAMYDLFAEGDLDAFRNRFYKAGFLKIYLHEKIDNNRYSSSHIFVVSTGFMYAVVSDSENLLSRYLQYKDNFLDTLSSALGKAIQAAITDNDDELQKQIGNLEKHTGARSIGKNYGGLVNGFKGLLQKEKSLIEKGIDELITKHQKQEQPAIVRNYLNIESLVLAKLAYRRGVVVTTKNPLVPNKTIPSAELNLYTVYDFIKNDLNL